MAALMIGTSGWVYPHWKGVFYPEHLNTGDWFAYYAERFDTVEINNSFYRLPERRTFENWGRAAPPGFVFTVKANSYITHRKKLKDPEESLRKFYANLSGMGDRCAVVLFQLPPGWRVNVSRLRDFLGAVPESYRIAFEFRDPSWLVEDVYSLLCGHNAALCSADSPRYPSPRVVTADFVFYRMHAGAGRDAPSYSRSELERLAGELEAHLARGLDAFVYFNNDYRGYAIHNALTLKGLMKKRRWSDCRSSPT